MLPSLTLVTDATKKPITIPLCEGDQFPSLSLSSQMAVRLSGLPASRRERCQCYDLCLEVLGAPLAQLTLPWFSSSFCCGCFFSYESDGVGSNSVWKCVNSGKLHISIVLLGKATYKNMSVLVSEVANSFSETSLKEILGFSPNTSRQGEKKNNSTKSQEPSN